MNLSIRHAALAIVLLSLAACSGAKDKADDIKATAAVKTAAAQTADVPEILTAYGAAEVAPEGEQTLTAPVEAIVVAVRVAPGANVVAGQVLVELKPSPKSAADQDEAAKALARAERLRASGLDSDADVEQAKAAVAAAAGAGGSLTVRAAKAGVVETLTAAPGDVVAAGASLGKVGASGSVSVRLGLEPSDAARVHAGDAVTLRSVGGGEIGAGQVASVQTRIDPQTRLAAAIVNARSAVAVGQSVEGDIVVRTLHAVTVPKAALVYDQDQPGVFVVAGGVAHRHDVTLGPAAGGNVAVLSGVNAGDKVVVEGAAALDDNMAVSEAGAAAKPAPADDKS